MGRHHHRLPPLVRQGAQEVQNLAGADAVEIASGFVGQEHEGFHDQGAGDGHTLLFAAGELIRAVRPATFQPHLIQNPAGAARRFRGGAAGDGERQRDVFFRREYVDKVEILKDDPDLPPAEQRPPGLVHGGHVHAADEDRPGRRPVQAGEQVKQGAFARTGRAHERHKFAGRRRQIDAAQGLDLRRVRPENLRHRPRGDDLGGKVTHG